MMFNLKEQILLSLWTWAMVAILIPYEFTKKTVYCSDEFTSRTNFAFFVNVGYGRNPHTQGSHKENFIVYCLDKFTS